MRSFGICAILLALAALAPPPEARTGPESLWGAGLLLLLAATGQGILARAGLPALTAWVPAAFLLGPSVLSAVDASREPLLSLAAAGAGVWVGLLVGLGARWPVERRNWRLPAVVAGSTLVTFAGLAAVLGLAGGLPLPAALVLAAVASFWGPLVSDFWRSREAQVIGLLGSGVALLLLAAVLLLEAGSRWVAAEAREWMASLVLSGAAGAAAAEALRRTGILGRRDEALLALGALTFLGAGLALHAGLPSLPIGLGAGLLLGARPGPGGELDRRLAPLRPTSILLFAALLVVSTNALSLVPPRASWPYQIVLAQIGVLVAARVLGPALWYPLPSTGEFSRRSGWLLLPRGLIAADLVLGAGGGLTRLLSPEHADLLRRLVLMDLLLGSVLLAALAALMQPRGSGGGQPPGPVLVPVPRAQYLPGPSRAASRS